MIFVNDAAIEDRLDAIMSVLCEVGDVERVPITEPQIRDIHGQNKARMSAI